MTPGCPCLACPTCRIHSEDMSVLLIVKATSHNVGLNPHVQTNKWLAQLAAIRELPTLRKP